MSKVLVVGASGSLGKETANYLSKYHDVTGTYCSTPIKNVNFGSIRLDVADADSFRHLDGKYDVVLLISGAMPATMEGYTPQRYIDVNITGMLNTLEYCRKQNVKKVVYIMTFSDVSGSFYTGIPIADDAPRSLKLTGDHAVYGISKIAACDLLEHYHQDYGLQTVVFRIPTIYCCDDNVDYYVDGMKRTKAYIKMIRSVVQKGKIEIWGNPKNAKDMPYIKDFVRLMDLAVKSEEAQGLYNAGTAQPVSLECFVDAVIKVFGKDSVEKIYRPERPSQPNFTFDMRKTQREFGYKPLYCIEEVLRDIKMSVDGDIWLQESY